MTVHLTTSHAIDVEELLNKKELLIRTTINHGFHQLSDKELTELRQELDKIIDIRLNIINQLK